MTLFRFQQSTAILILSASLSAVPSLAQATTQTANAQTPQNPAAMAPVNGKVIEDIVARVNDQIITQSDYDRAAEQLDGEPSSRLFLPTSCSRSKPIYCATSSTSSYCSPKARNWGSPGKPS
jgi:hypothetical protein